MYEQFSLVLMVNHACNLRCTYCYTGAKTHRPMSLTTARRAIDAACASVRPGGSLELGFFGGEPLLEVELLLDSIAHAERLCRDRGIDLRLGLTTNGTIDDGSAWRVLTWPGLVLHVSHDGLPAVHDRHRVTAGGEPHGTSAQVLATIQRLIDAAVDVRVTMVVRPDTVAHLPAGIAWLRSRGVRRIDPSLDVWSHWQREDLTTLETSLIACAELWRSGLPTHSIGWFDERAAQLASVSTNGTARCAWGAGEIAVAPSGRLYPCERVIGEDPPDHPLALAVELAQCDDFLFDAHDRQAPDECDSCAMQSLCSTFCRCSNYVRTGDVNRPDGLLCFFNQVCLRETARVLRPIAVPSRASVQLEQGALA